MKIAIIGYSGSGKSTLARRLAALYNLPTLHLDTIHFLPNWQTRDQAEKLRLTQSFLDAHPSWVIDGNYSNLCYERRMQEADQIILLLFNRIDCLLRVTRRYRRFRNTTRPDMAAGCTEKLDWEFVRWVLWEGRGKQARERYRNVIARYHNKAIVLRNQRQLDAYLASLTPSPQKQ